MQHQRNWVCTPSAPASAERASTRASSPPMEYRNREASRANSSRLSSTTTHSCSNTIRPTPCTSLPSSPPTRFPNSPTARPRPPSHRTLRSPRRPRAPGSRPDPTERGPRRVSQRGASRASAPGSSSAGNAAGGCWRWPPGEIRLPPPRPRRRRRRSPPANPLPEGTTRPSHPEARRRRGAPPPRSASTSAPSSYSCARFPRPNPRFAP
mmetsp:Transcript_26937/g.43803  ORF Transcript_26937/g.43803 Transcript_26937/m.43803 type:complete len:209 (+) Transcript_26937:222-848(+)